MRQYETEEKCGKQGRLKDGENDVKNVEEILNRGKELRKERKVRIEENKNRKK